MFTPNNAYYVFEINLQTTVDWPIVIETILDFYRDDIDETPLFLKYIRARL